MNPQILAVLLQNAATTESLFTAVSDNGGSTDSLPATPEFSSILDSLHANVLAAPSDGSSADPTGVSSSSSPPLDWIGALQLAGGLLPSLSDSTGSSSDLGSVDDGALATDALSSFPGVLQGQAPVLPDAMTSAGLPSVPDAYRSDVLAAAEQYHVDPALISAVANQESGFDPLAASSAGAEGIMQLMPATAAQLGVANPYNASENIQAGTLYLSRLIAKYGGSVPMALAAYNAGSGTLSQLGINTPQELTERYSSLPRETQDYVRRVMQVAADDRSM